MWRLVWIFTRAFVLSLIFLLLVDVTESVTRRLEQHQGVEGKKCQLSNGGGRGKCVKMINCPGKITEIFTGRYNALDRCGFLKNDEIVCCKVKQRRLKQKLKNTKRRLRPADAACPEYQMPWNLVVYSRCNRLYIPPDNLPCEPYVAESAPAEFPHMAALVYAVSKEGAPERKSCLCGGTLISKRHVLTAAHCVSNIENRVPFEVLLGVTDLEKMEEGQLQRFSISKITKHPRYRRSFHYHDIAVLKLDKRVNFTKYVRPTCLMTKSPSEEKATPELVVLGWGDLDTDGTPVTTLRKARGLDYVRETECSRTYLHTRAKLPQGLDKGMICVRDPNIHRNADTCTGDSGGPLLGTSGPLGPLVGVTSFGVVCGEGLPSVYTSVYEYLSWIEAQVWPKRMLNRSMISPKNVSRLSRSPSK